MIATVVVTMCSPVVTMCSPVTGRCSFLPPVTVEGYSHVLLPGDGDDDKNTGHSFRLLVVDLLCRTQTFSSRTVVWGPVIKTPSPAEVVPYRCDRVQPAAVVFRGVAHWLCHDPSLQRYHVLAVRIDTGKAAGIEIPQYCLRRR